MSDYMNYRVHVSFSKKKQKFEGKVYHMGSRQRVGFYDTHEEAEIFVRKRIEEIKKEKKASKGNPFEDLSNWNRAAAESRQRILAKYGAGIK